MKVYISGFPKHRWYHNWLFEKFGYENKQKVYVKIDDYDTWSMDCTLAHIVVPMLKQLRDEKHGNSIVDMEDRPDHLIGTIPGEHELDEFYEEAWDWVMGEMLFAFESKHDDWEGNEAYQARISNGFRLFGKYYEGLWD